VRATIALLERVPVLEPFVLIALTERPAQKVAPTVTPAQVDATYKIKLLQTD